VATKRGEAVHSVAKGKFVARDATRVKADVVKVFARAYRAETAAGRAARAKLKGARENGDRA
jgi:hypothetical protein